MKITINNRYNRSIIYEHDCEENTIKKTVGQAVKEKVSLYNADLCNADLCNADLCNADLYNADLSGANLSGANLSGANLSDANLNHADLRDANLSDANLSGANLNHADLCNADLCNADLDYSCFPLWCGSFNIKCDIRLFSQLAFHMTKLDCNDPEIKKIQKYLSEIAEKFHRFDECKDK